jgi:hypothetical protein
MALAVACLVHPTLSRYRKVARAMQAGIDRCGDRPFLHPIDGPMSKQADVAVCYGWKRHAAYDKYRKFVYADLGYWHRETHYRLVVGGWSPESYVRAGLPHSRLETLGVTVKPWREGGDTIVIAGSTAKASAEHGTPYRQWEIQAAQRLHGSGKRIVYRPKPSDPHKSPIPSAEYDVGKLQETLDRACCVVTHHSNTAIDALVEGVPVHCEVGAAAAFSVPLESAANPQRLERREQFLADVAWLNWSVQEMERGEAWAHMKDRGLVC